MAAPATLLDKIWSSHSILDRPDGVTLLHIDRHLVHDGSGNAFRMLRQKGLAVRRPDCTFATPDHYVSTVSHDLASINEPHRRAVVEDLHANAAAAGLTLFALNDRRQGIVHVVGPEQGISQPGMVMVCGDSHTATHGALGALAFGVGASEVAHVLATQTLWQRKPKNMRIIVEGTLGPGRPMRRREFITLLGGADIDGEVLGHCSAVQHGADRHAYLDGAAQARALAPHLRFDARQLPACKIIKLLPDLSLLEVGAFRDGER
jgi:hypothetical protein